MPLDPSQEDFKYWAFISYSHSDDKWADWLHKSLETYKVPKHLVGKPSREGIVPSRPFPVFRDRDELPGSANLGDNIEAALRLSRYLIVICSPNAVQSKWVDKEIRMFKSWGREDRVLCLIVDGEPNASVRPELGLQECLPDAVRHWVDEAGKITDIPTEPIAADARKGKDGKKNAVLKLLAGVLGVNFDDLKQRDYERHERRRKVALAFSFALLLTFSVLGVAFFFQKNEAVAAKNAAEAERVIAETARSLAEARAKEAEEARLLETQARQKEEAARVEAQESAKREALAAEQARKAEREAVLAKSRAEEQKAIAEDERRKATEKELEVSRTLSVSDLTAASKLIEESAEGKALAYLSRALRYDPDNMAVVSRAISLLSQRNWPMLVGEPLQYDSPVKGVMFSQDGKWLVTVAGNSANVLDAATKKPAYPPLKHVQRITIARFSPDGKLLLTASEDGVAQLWNLPNGERVNRPLQHKDSILDACFSADGAMIATACQDRTARVWSTENSQPRTPPLQHGGPVAAVVFNLEGNALFTASQTAARIWDLTIAENIGVVMNHEGGISCLAVSPDGKLIASAAHKAARLWDSTTGVAVGSVMLHDDWITSLKFSPDGKRLLTSSRDATVRLWQVSNCSVLGEPMRHDAAVSTATFSPNGKLILSASMDGTARIWNSETTQSAAEPMRHIAPVKEAQFSADGAYVATGSDDRSAKIWTVLSSKPIGERFKHDQQVNAALFSPDGKVLATISADRTARLWDVRTGKSLADPLRHKKEGRIISAAFSPDGKLLATGSEDLTAQIWDVATGKVMHAAPIEHERSITTIEFSPDGKRVLTGSDDRRVKVWEVETGRLAVEPLRHDAEVKAASFSADGTWIITASSDKKARIWAAGTGQLLCSVAHNDDVLAVALSPDKKWLVTGSDDRTACVWNAITGEPLIKPIVHDSPVNFVAFTPPDLWNDKKNPRAWILTASEKVARLWEAETGKAVTEPMQHKDTIKAASFSPSGQFVLTAYGHFAQVWDTSGKSIADPFQHDAIVRSARFSPDGNSFTTASADQSARIWFFTLHGQAPSWLKQMVSSIGGYRLDNFGAAELIGDAWRRLDGTRNEAISRADEDLYSRWARWFTADRRNRSLSPFTSTPVAEYILRRIEDGSPAALNEVLELQPDNGMALVKLAHVSRDPSEMEFLSKLAQNYEPFNPDVLWIRAQILQGLNRPNEALAIMEQAIQLDPRNIVSFGPDGSEFSIVRQEASLAEGWLPKGWADSSSFPYLHVSYLKLQDAPRPNLTAIEIKVQGNARGQADVRGPRFVCRRNGKCVIEGWVRSASKSDLNVIVGQFIAPYERYKEQVVRTTPEWKPFRIQFTPTQDIAAELRLLENSGATIQVAGLIVKTD